MYVKSTLGYLGVHRQDACDSFSQGVRTFGGGLGVVESLDGDFIDLAARARESKTYEIHRGL